MALAPYIFMAINITIAILTSLQYTYPEVAQICYTVNAYNASYVSYAQTMALVADTLAILIYLVVIYEYRRRYTVVNNENSRLNVQTLREVKQQRKVTNDMCRQAK
jgi:hypothetical protein